MTATHCDESAFPSARFETIETAPTEGATSHRSLTKSAHNPAKNRKASMATTQNNPALRPDDHRHGTNAGHVAGCRQKCCNDAKLRYDKARKREAHVRGHGRVVPALGYRRRIQALNALGWPLRLIADELGISLGTLSARMYKAEWVYKRNLDALIPVYDRFSMRTYGGALAARTRRNAAERGYAPPLAWDDIDHDSTPADYNNSTEFSLEIDEVKVERVLSGIRADCTTPERLRVIERWDGSLSELERLTGWNVHRLINERKAA